MGYCKRFITVMAMMSACALLPRFVKPVMDTTSALGFEISLLFAVVAFQLLISSFLPVTSTTTILDQYAIFLFFFVFMCMCVVVIESQVETQDPWIHTAWLSAFWGVAHVYFGVMVWLLLTKQEEKLLQRDIPKRKAFVIHAGQNVGDVVHVEDKKTR